MAGLLAQWLARLGEDVAGMSEALLGDKVERQLDQDIRDIDDALHRARAEAASAKARRIVASELEREQRTRIAELTRQAEQALRSRKRSQARTIAEQIAALDPLHAETKEQLQSLQQRETELAHVIEHGEHQLRRLKHQIDTLRASASLRQAQATVARRRATDTPEPALEPAQRARKRKTGGPESRPADVSSGDAGESAVDDILERIAKRIKPKASSPSSPKR